MKFTQSVDGVKRADVRVTLRLSRDNIAVIKARAQQDNVPWRDWLKDAAEEGVYSGLLYEGDIPVCCGKYATHEWMDTDLAAEGNYCVRCGANSTWNTPGGSVCAECGGAMFVDYSSAGYSGMTPCSICNYHGSVKAKP